MKVWNITLLISLFLPCSYIGGTECIISEKYYNIPNENCLQYDSAIVGELRLFVSYEGAYRQIIVDNNQVITISEWWKLRKLYLEGNSERTVFVNISEDTSKDVQELHIKGETRFTFLGNIRMLFPNLEVLRFNGRYSPFSWEFKMFRNLTILDIKYIRPPSTEMEFGTTAITSNWFDGLDNLRNITISNAGITKLTKFAFTSLKNLTYLDLSDNNIKIIPHDIFNGKNLSFLDLSGNGIKYVYAGSFRGLLGGIEHLKLNRNPNFPLDTLINIPAIHTMEIAYNNYTIISSSILFKPGDRIDISGNFLACSCENSLLVALSKQIECYTSDYTPNTLTYPLADYIIDNCTPLSLYDYLCFVVKCKPNEVCNNQLVRQKRCKIVRFIEDNINSTSEEVSLVDIQEDNCGCECQEGFQMGPKGICIDVDECALGSSDCEQTCVNLEGAYECGCMYGYEKSAANPYTCTCSNTYNIYGYPIQTCVPIYLVNSLRAWIVIITSLLILCCLLLLPLASVLIGVKTALDRWADRHSREDKCDEADF